MTMALCITYIARMHVQIFVRSAKKSLVKTMLRNVVQKMQDLARRGDSNAGGRPRPNGTTVNGHTNEVKLQIVTIFINILYLI